MVTVTNFGVRISTQTTGRRLLFLTKAIRRVYSVLMDSENCLNIIKTLKASQSIHFAVLESIYVCVCQCIVIDNKHLRCFMHILFMQASRRYY